MRTVYSNILVKTTLLMLVVFSGMQATLMAQQASSRPNIILIMTDDQGYGDFGYTGNPDIQTPVLDRLAKQSVNFDQFYVHPVCAPTRASLMTGRSYAKTGVYDTYNGGALMATEETTIAEILRDNGYATGIFGKWHLGDNYPMRPQDQGFDESLVHLSGGIGQPGDYLNYFEYDSSYFDPILMQNGEPTQTEGYCSDVYTDYLIDFIQQNSNKPFFAYLPFNAPHTPLQVPQKYYDMYADMEIEPSEYPNKPRSFPDMDKGDLESTKRLYGMISNIDDNIGRILETLSANNLEENTLVIFLSDNGPQGSRYKSGLRAGKTSAYEGGIRVPMLIRYPGTFNPNTRVETPSAHIDLLPTLLDLLDVSSPPDVDGKSLLPLINGQSVDWAEDRSLYFYWDRGYPEPYRNISVRRGNYKLVGHTDHLSSIEEFELFNISEDPAELNNLVDRQTAIARDLKQNFDNFYSNLIGSEHMVDPPRIVVGTRHENPVVLNRNDAKGAPGMWNQDHIFAYWNVEVTQDAKYDVTVNFLNELPSPGKYVLKIGPIQRTVVNKKEGRSQLEISKVPLKKGKWSLESWYLNNEGNFIAPFTVELRRL